jgi:hypothetical protein
LKCGCAQTASRCAGNRAICFKEVELGKFSDKPGFIGNGSQTFPPTDEKQFERMKYQRAAALILFSSRPPALLVPLTADQEFSFCH